MTPQRLSSLQGCWFVCRRGRESARSFADLTRPRALPAHRAPRRRSGQSPGGPHRAVLRVGAGCPHWTGHVLSGCLVSRVQRATPRGSERPHGHSPTVLLTLSQRTSLAGAGAAADADTDTCMAMGTQEDVSLARSGEGRC